MRNDLISTILENDLSPDLLFDVIYEYYAGGNKDLAKCEQYLEELKELAGPPGMDTTFNFTRQQINEQTPANKKLEKTLERFFKIKQIRIYWRSTGSPNGLTVTNSVMLRSAYKANHMSGKESNFNLYIVLSTELFTVCDMTPREVMAVILHEIGHNFYFCPFQTYMSLVTAIMSFGLVPLMQLGAKILIGAVLDMDAWLKENSKLYGIINNVISAGQRVMFEINSFIGFTNLILKLADGARLVTTNPINAIFGYGAEKGADSFATKYGYGADLISGLKKIKVPENSYYGKAVRETNLFNISNQIRNLTDDVLTLCTLNVHPSINQRAQSTLEKLKDDYKKGDFPPELKKNLEQEIAYLEETMDTVNVYQKNSKAPQIGQAIYSTLDHVTKGHTDFREIMNIYYKNTRF